MSSPLEDYMLASARGELPSQIKRKKIEKELKEKFKKMGCRHSANMSYEETCAKLAKAGINPN